MRHDQIKGPGLLHFFIQFEAVGMIQGRHDPGLVEFSATLTKDQSPDAVRDAIFKTIDDVVTNPPTAADVERVRSQLLLGLENSLSNPQSIATGALNNQCLALIEQYSVRGAISGVKLINRYVRQPRAGPERSVSDVGDTAGDRHTSQALAIERTTSNPGHRVGGKPSWNGHWTTQAAPRKADPARDGGCAVSDGESEIGLH